MDRWRFTTNLRSYDLADRLATASPTGRDVRAFGRLFYAQARRSELDKQGRLRIPPELSQWASLGSEMVLVGVGDHLELWDTTQWQSYTNQRRGRYDELAESAFSNRAGDLRRDAVCNGFSDSSVRFIKSWIRPSVGSVSGGSRVPVSGHLPTLLGRRCGASIPCCRKKRSRRYLENECE